MTDTFGDVAVDLDAETFVATVELRRPPNNFFDVELIRSLADAYAALDADPACRAIVLAAEGKHFCAGADFSGSSRGTGAAGDLYAEAARLFEAATPVVAAVQGAAVGGGLGLACSADFRVGSPETRLTANFSRLGFHHGFGLTVTLPPLVGQQRANELLYTGRRIDGATAAAIGLLDRLAPTADAIRGTATELAAEIAAAAPLAVVSIRSTMRDGLADRVRAATVREDAEQARLRETADFREGIRASGERREPRFEGR
jgi:2-(1,2-epoxy-1,2-dihydrophenyl)acetyl-CoA isomerase